MFMRQCDLRQPTESGERALVTWIDERFATVGNEIEVRGASPGEWRVVAVYQRQEESLIRQGNLDAIGKYGRSL